MNEVEIIREALDCLDEHDPTMFRQKALAALDVLATNLRRAEDQVRSYKLLSEQRHDKIRRLEGRAK